MIRTESFQEVARRYRVVFFDAYGVLKNSMGVLDGALDAIHSLKQAGVECYVITNDSSRSPARMALAYQHAEHGALLPAESIISSGMLASEFLALKIKTGAVAYLGKPDSAYYISEAGLTPVPVAEAAGRSDLRALAFLDDEGFDWATDLNRTVNLLRQSNIPTIVANADMSYPVRRGEYAIAVGNLAAMVETIVKRAFLRFGKPDPQIFSFALARARLAIPDLTKRDLLMVGDTLQTDILGANKFGIDTALVLSGNTHRDEAQHAIDASGIIPDYVCESILS